MEAVCSLCLRAGWSFDHVYDAKQGGQPDEHWITAFARTGGDAIVTADADFINRYPAVIAVFNTGLKVIHLPKRYANAKGHLQAGFILIWWPRIEAQLEGMNKRECYQPEWNVSGETGTLKKVDIDFARAHQKAKKAK